MAVAEELQIIIDAKVTQAVKDLKKVQKGIGDNEKQTSGLIKAFKSLAGPVALGAVILGMVRLGKASLKAFAIQEQAEARLEQTIKSTGEAAGLTADELTSMATALQGVTKFGDEAIIGAEALLLTFKNIGRDTFPRALESILDVSEGMGTGLKESSIQVGKALNDPIQGITALTRVGITFTVAQKEMIKALVKAGDKAGAQGVILEELESQFGGVAKAAADTASGSMTQFTNVIGDLQEQLGQSITEGLQPFVKESTKVIKALVEMIKEGREVIKVLDGIREGGDVSGVSIEALQDSLARLNAERAAGAALGVNKNLKEEIAAVKGLIAAYGIQDSWLIRLKTDQLALIRAGDDKAAAEKAASDLAQTELELLQEAFANTHDGQVKAIEAQIEFFETFKEGPMSIAVLADLKEELTKMTEKAEEFGEVLSVAWQGPLEKINDTWLETIDTMGLVADMFKKTTEAVETQHTAIVAAGEDWLSIEQAKVEHLIWIDALETEINERRIKEAAEELKAFETLIKQKITLVKQYSNMALSFLSAIDTLQANNANAELMRLQEEGASQEELDAKKREIAHDEALRRKNFALMNIGLNTAIAIVAALTSIPPNVPLSLAVGAVGAAQLAAAASIPIPALATGGDFVTTGPTPIMVGDNASGQERVTVEPLGGTGGNGNEKIWLSIDGQGFWAVMQREGIDNRKIHSSNGGRI